MKKLLTCLVMIASFLVTFTYASPCVEKIYVSAENLVVQEEGIFVNINNEWFLAESLFTDIGGTFVKHLYRLNNCDENYFPCRNCGRCVYDMLDICPHCKRPS